MGHIIKGLKSTIPWLWMAAVEPVLRAPNKYARLKVSARTPQAGPEALTYDVTGTTGVRSVVRNLDIYSLLEAHCDL